MRLFHIVVCLMPLREKCYNTILYCLNQYYTILYYTILYDVLLTFILSCAIRDMLWVCFCTCEGSAFSSEFSVCQGQELKLSPQGCRWGVTSIFSKLWFPKRLTRTASTMVQHCGSGLVNRAPRALLAAKLAWRMKCVITSCGRPHCLRGIS